MFAVMNIAAQYIAIFFGRNELTNIARVLAIGFINHSHRETISLQ